jgi:hypothetical protein
MITFLNLCKMVKVTYILVRSEYQIRIVYFLSPDYKVVDYVQLLILDYQSILFYFCYAMKFEFKTSHVLPKFLTTN